MDWQSRKAALLQEFEREIAPARMRLAAQLPQLWQQTYGYGAQTPVAAVAAGGARVGAKRISAAGGAGPELKRPRTEEMERRMEPLLKECQKIIKKLHNIQASLWFRRPVDPIKDGCPNYPHFVKNPMDLGTIRTRLQVKHYRTPMEFKADVDQVWINCAIYNQEGTDARVAGDKCKDVFERAWRDSGIEAQMQAIQDELENAPQTTGPMQEHILALSSQLARAVEQLPAVQQERGARGDMSFAEKRRLSTQLSSWMPQDQYQAVLDIVSQDPRVAMAGDGEVEVELDDLRAETLRRLQDLLDPQAPRPVQQQQQRPVAARPVAIEGGAGNTADKRLPARHQNGTASPQSSGGGSESNSGEHSPNEVKGSTMDDPRQGPTNFVRDTRHVVDESATNPKEQSQFVKDRAAARKADVNINAANWDLPSMPSADAGAADAPHEGDDMWKSFQSIAEQKQHRAEQQRMEAEAAERQRREERERLKREEEERQRRLKDEEERQQAELQQQREAQLQKELEEIKAQAGTANLTQQTDIAMLASMAAHSADSGGLAAVGLELADDNDMMFEDI